MARTKKDFTNVNPVYDAIAEATAQETHVIIPDPDNPVELEIITAQDTHAAQPAQPAQRTQGRKRGKMLRINMAFSDANADYIETMARVSGQTITAFVNNIISKHAAEHEEIYRKALEFRKGLE